MAEHIPPSRADYEQQRRDQPRNSNAEPPISGDFAWAGVDSNHRLTDYESAALTN
jgi:hypothetical protein